MHWTVAGFYNRDREYCLQAVSGVSIEPVTYRQIKNRTRLHPHQVAAALARLLKTKRAISTEAGKYRRR